MKFEDTDKLNDLRAEYKYISGLQYDMSYYDSNFVKLGDRYLTKQDAPEVFEVVEKYLKRKKEKVIQEIKSLGVEI